MKTKQLFTSCFFILVTLMTAKAQEIVSRSDSSNYRKSCYAYLGFGYGGQKSATNFGFVIQVNDKSILAYSVQATRLTKLVNGYSVMSSISPVKQTTSNVSSLLYGRIFKQPWGHIILMAGPSLARITRWEHPEYFGGYSGEAIVEPGLSMQASVNPSAEFIGLGVNLFVNLNATYTHAGITISLSLGNVNYKKKKTSNKIE